MRINVNDSTVPAFLYGTAWKETVTEQCVNSALESGFRGIDSANQRKFYDEQSVGSALANCYNTKVVSREDLFLQSKFTHARDQDGHLPYEENAELGLQMKQSFESSLQNLNTDYLDSYLLHNLSEDRELSESDVESWKAMEVLFKQGRIKFLGVCNVGIAKLQELHRIASVKPSFVQNKCYARQGWDRDVRMFCTKNNMRYQSFSLLSANTDIFKQGRFQEIVKRYECTEAQLVFRFALQSGMMPITGTRSTIHMKEDLDTYDLRLTSHDMHLIEFI